MKRYIRYLFEIIGAFVIIIVVGLGALMWRLDQGPLVLHNAIPEIESALNDMSPGLHFKIGSVQMETNQTYRAIRLRLKDVQFFNEKNNPVGKLDEALLSFNWHNLAGFSWMPVAVRIAHPSVEITRFPNGYVGFNLQEVKEQENSASVTSISNLLGNGDGVLNHIRITDAHLRYNDLQEDYSLEASNGLFDFHRKQDQIAGTMSVDVKSKDFEQVLQGTITYDPVKKQNHLSVGMKDFMLSKIRGLTGRIPPELHVTTPVNLLLTADLDNRLQLMGVDFTMTGQKTALKYAPYYPEEVIFNEVLANAHYTPQEKNFELKNFIAKFGNSQLVVKGNMSFDKAIKKIDESPITFDVHGVVDNVPVDSLKQYWPHELGTNARDWVTNQIRDGVATSAGLDLNFIMSPQQEVSIKKLSGKIAFTDLTVDYLPPMTPVKGVNGSIVFSDKSFDITTTSGKVFETVVPKGFVRINHLLEEDPDIEIAIDTMGPLKDAITLLSSEPLKYAQKMGMSPEQFTGTGTTALKLAFPLAMDLKMEQVKMSAASKLENITAKKVIKDLSISAKAMDLAVDEHHLVLTGNASVEGNSADVEWQEYFSDDAEDTTVINAKGEVGPATLKALRIPVEGYFAGTANADVKLHQDKEKNVYVTVDADTTRSTFTIPELNVQKKVGSPGKLALKVTADKGGALTISEASTSWPDFSISQGMARFNSRQELESATLKNIKIGRSKADVIVTPKGNNSTQVVVRGDVIDFSSAWANMRSQTSKDPNPRRYDLSLRVGKLYLDPEVPLLNMKADLSVKGDDVIAANISAQTDKNGSLTMRQVEQKDSSRVLAIQAANTGRVLQALDLSDGVYNGILKIDGKSSPKAPREIKGQMTLDKFTMIKAPVMARLLNAFSPAGLLSLLNNKGLNFEKMQSDFILPDAKTIHLENGKMAGDSLGLSFGGYIYRDTGQLDLKGTIIPLEGINKFLGKIPVLGQILTGIKGNGIIGATYKITGPSSDPKVSVNPLSAFTPGIFRSILFEGSD